jgi:hypothetical protein
VLKYAQCFVFKDNVKVCDVVLSIMGFRKFGITNMCLGIKIEQLLNRSPFELEILFFLVLIDRS